MPTEQRTNERMIPISNKSQSVCRSSTVQNFYGETKIN